ncbi:unnamed protein product [Rhizophagus irregularis]|uniref:Uncharacterized protein n=1 Tax=Rhizophagus irregularis TaxID=588596 RepID=A0A916E4Z8_9GLOM|nr:unnamed protein product [Rhizophagus irregularis]
MPSPWTQHFRRFVLFLWLGFEYLNLTASFSSNLCTRRLLQVFSSLDMTFRQLFQPFFDADSWDNRKHVGLDGPGHTRFWRILDSGSPGLNMLDLGNSISRRILTTWSLDA